MVVSKPTVASPSSPHWSRTGIELFPGAYPVAGSADDVFGRRLNLRRVLERVVPVLWIVALSARRAMAVLNDLPPRDLVQVAQRLDEVFWKERPSYL